MAASIKKVQAMGISIIVCWAILLCNILSANAQSKTDTASINQLLAKAYSLRETSSDSSGMLYGQALDASKKVNYRDGIAESYCGLGRYYNIKNEQEKTLFNLRKGIPYCGDNIKGRDLKVTIYILLSESFYYAGRYDSCAWYRYEALDLVENNRNTTSLPIQLKVYSKILQFWVNAHEDIKNDAYIGHIMQRINGLEAKALEKNDSSMLVNIYFQKAAYYHNANKNDSSRYYGLKNIQLAKAMHMVPSMIMSSYVNMAITYLADKEPAKAIESLNKAIQEAPMQGRETNRYLVFADIFLGEAY